MGGEWVNQRGGSGVAYFVVVNDKSKPCPFNGTGPRDTRLRDRTQPGVPVNTTKILRHINAARCLRLLRTSGSVSRADMARLLGLNRSTTGHAIAALLEAGLVAELEEPVSDGPGRKGRPGVRVALAASGAYAIGLDVGTRELSGVLIDLQMGTVCQTTLPAGPDFRHAPAVLDKLHALTTTLLGQGGIDPAKVLGVGVSVPGLVDRQGRVVNAPFLEWRDFDLTGHLRDRLPPDWRIEARNDADCFAAAECAAMPPDPADHLNHVDHLDHFLVLLLNEGIGSALVSGGAVVQGAHGHAGEIGHALVRTPEGVASFDQVAGAIAFSAFFAADCPVSEGVALLMRRRQEPGVAAALSRWATDLGLGLVNAVHLLDPGRIVLGGALSNLYPLVADQVTALLSRHLIHGFSVPPIAVTRFGPDGAAIGAAAVVRESVFELPRVGA